MKPLYQLVLILLSYLILSPCSCHQTLNRNRTNNIQCIYTEREALLQFRHGITKDYCGLLTYWGSQTDCCQWEGVVCSSSSSHVVKLSLTGFGLQACLEGKMSPFLGELKHLEHLNLSYNNFHGELPHYLGNLSKLTTLDLSYAYNGVVQSLPWISRLTLLEYLDLSGINLREVRNWMTIVTNFPSLRVLSMEYCELSTEILSSISYVNSSTTLHTINLSTNYLNDTSIRRWLFNLLGVNTQLVHLDLSNNAFQGSVLKVISNLCNLKQLYLGNNNFNGELSTVIHSLVKCNNKTLLVLNLNKNRFWGGIPDDIGSLSSLRELSLGRNQLEGAISPSIRQLTMLEILDVSSNFFEGTLTRTLFSSLASLRQISLSDNSGLEIRIEEDWIPPFKLDIIQLRSCKLGPRFPKWLQLQTNFSEFDVSNTSISDSLHVSFWNSLSPNNLIYLNMSYNQFYGMLPNMSYMLYAFAIDLSSNLFEGVVPSGFANTTFVYLNGNRFSNCTYFLCPKAGSMLLDLDLSNNLFSGELPDCWMNLSSLVSLHLENNEFSGRIPNSMGTLVNLQILHLDNNTFSGSFPAAFESFTSLLMLNLGDNLFSGNIPQQIGNGFQSLGALMLSNNCFTGEIPESICQLNHLQILDLSTNQLSGVIPKCFGNFTGMEDLVYEISALDFSPQEVILNNNVFFESDDETTTVSWKREEQKLNETIKFVKYIDLSANELRGEIPAQISILNGLESLDLSKNRLSGNIPLEIGNLTDLEFLDLSNNYLTGEIPISLANVTYLGTLDVSNNNLSGQIPVSTQLQSFDASHYAGNPRLCGAPLPSCSKNRAPPNSNVTNEDNIRVQDKDRDFGFLLGLCISVMLGFIFGFWGVCGTLIIKTSWRHAYFRFLDNIKDRIL